MKTLYDVIVVGGGGSGLAAAVSAAENGMDVAILEKNSHLGGTTGIAIGSFSANRTLLQRKAGIEDTLESHVEDAAKFADPEIDSRNNDDLRRFFLGHSGETIQWLMDMGVSFYGPNPEPPNRVPRMHNAIPNAKAYIAALQVRLLRLRGTIICKTPVCKLVCDNGQVNGVEARIEGKSTLFKAKQGVVLATGDYPNSAEIIAKYKGPQYSNIGGINETATGDGHLLAREVGARLVNMDLTYGPEIRFIPSRKKNLTQILPAKGPLARIMGRLMPLVPQAVVNTVIKRLLVTWQHPENAILDDGAILVNSRGGRFCDETRWPDREIAIAAQPDGICYLLLDKRLIERYSAWPHFVSTAPEIAYAYVADYLRLRPDIAVSDNSVERVAQRRNIPPGALRQTVESFNRFATGITSDPFDRGGNVRPLDGNRWVLLGPAKAYFTTTAGGVAIDEQLHVLDDSGSPIPGLYAVGLVGTGGQVLWGHGLNIAWALTSGRLVGKCIANSDSFALPYS
ncbi:MAG: FAD-dependent oxidoreductase [Pirellulales bacterium]|nr:FAD-dependent oxidoreductase [Pirellulales bacterium]